MVHALITKVRQIRLPDFYYIFVDKIRFIVRFRKKMFFESMIVLN